MDISNQFKKMSKKFKESKNIFIIGHKNLDLDALGGSLALYEILNKKGKNCYLVINDQNHELAVAKVIEKVSSKLNIITGQEVEEKLGDKNLLIIVDTNKEYLVQDSTILAKIKNLIVIDHHEQNEDSIQDGLVIVNQNASSTCEMIAEYLYDQNLKLKATTATFLLSGIVLDTNNFVLKTNETTYFMAFFLTTLGANPSNVQKLMKQDINDYIKRQKVITNMKILNDKIALAFCSNDIKYRREELAKIADTLLLFNNIEESYVCGHIDKEKIGLSARSIGKTDVGDVANKFGGGGDKTEAAAVIENKSLTQIEKELIDLIK